MQKLYLYNIAQYGKKKVYTILHRNTVLQHKTTVHCCKRRAIASRCSFSDLDLIKKKIYDEKYHEQKI
jgi:hypothetical protein